MTQWHPELEEAIANNDYSTVIQFYETQVATQPDIVSNYYFLGLAHLLSGDEATAQIAWMTPILELVLSAEEIEHWTEYLFTLLVEEAKRQKAQDNLVNSWLLRAHAREINPDSLSNLLYLLDLSLLTNRLTVEQLISWQVKQILENQPLSETDQSILLSLLRKIAKKVSLLHPETLDFLQVGFSRYSNPILLIDSFFPIISEISVNLRKTPWAILVAESLLELDPANTDLLRQLVFLHHLAETDQKALEYAQRFEANARDSVDQVYAKYLALICLKKTGTWKEILAKFEEYKNSIEDLSQVSVQETPFNKSTLLAIPTTPFYFPYLADHAEENRRYTNQVNSFFQEKLSEIHRAKGYKGLTPESLAQRRGRKEIRVGYISQCFRSHSVGWLSRWLFKYHNHDGFKFYAYTFWQKTDAYTNLWFEQRVDVFRDLGTANYFEIAKQILADEIDILVDMDSLTSGYITAVTALKPAPIQVTWLGWDASGIPAVDYFIADPHVLPANAQDYYQEKLIRLPDTYVAVDGFEVGVPSFRRAKFGIPADAVVYFSIYRPQKRHPDTLHWQMRIIEAVPNAYFCIKLSSDNAREKELILEVAQAENVSPERIKFLNQDPDEATHRANLSMMDVVLDNYPYNGATTTLETLWVGVPMVTRVGKQFSARNSYAFMMNVGVTEGISQSEEEYIAWGIRLGKDEGLRQKVAWKLRQARQCSPLWNASQFTFEMEKAYQHIWQTYVQSEL